MKHAKSQTNVNEIRKDQINFIIGYHEVFYFMVLLGIGLFFLILFYKKILDKQKKMLKIMEKLRENILDDVQQHCRNFSENLQYLSKQLKESNHTMYQAFENSKLIPDNHVLVPLQVGESFHILPSGYTIKIDRKFEHKSVSEAVLGRELAVNEIVHHIYAPEKSNNAIENLCVMDRDLHDIFHTYLHREKTLKGKYPSILNQRLILKEHFKGILLDEALKEKNYQFPPVKPFVEKFPNEDNEFSPII